VTNLIGNGIATVVVAQWENEFDAETAKAVLNGETPKYAEAGIAAVAEAHSDA
jgi:aerobic C4-dicarboxylate transport protein